MGKHLERFAVLLAYIAAPLLWMLLRPQAAPVALTSRCSYRAKLPTATSIVDGTHKRVRRGLSRMLVVAILLFGAIDAVLWSVHQDATNEGERFP